MAEDTVYISDLDPILELAPTDSFVVETLEGTNRILFRDFILGPDNVSFYEEVAANTIAIISLSSDVLTLDEDGRCSQEKQALHKKCRLILEQLCCFHQK